MPGISKLDVLGLRRQMLTFDASYVEDWRQWMGVLQSRQNVASNLGRVLRRWQACRPNRMRRSRFEAKHDPPYLEDLIAEAGPSVVALHDFEMRNLTSFTPETESALRQLWGTFEKLSYHGKARNGLAGSWHL